MLSAFRAAGAWPHYGFSGGQAADANVQEAADNQPEKEHEDSDGLGRKHILTVPQRGILLNDRRASRARWLTFGQLESPVGRRVFGATRGLSYIGHPFSRELARDFTGAENSAL